MVPQKDATGIFPGDGRAGFHLGPADLRGLPAANAPLGHEIVNASLSLLITGIPILNGTVFDLGMVQGNDFHHGGVQLVFVAHGGRAPFEVAHITSLVGHDERPLKLARIGGIDPEIGGKFHGAAHPLGDITERAITEHRRIKGRKIVVAYRHGHADVFPDQVGMVTERLTERTKDNPLFSQRILECGFNRHTVNHRINGHTSQMLLLLQGNTQLVEGLNQFRVYLVQTGIPGFLHRCRIITDRLEINGRYFQISPVGHLHFQPFPVGVQSEFQHEIGLFLLLPDCSDHLFIQTLLDNIGLNIGVKPVFIFALSNLMQNSILVFHYFSVHFQTFKTGPTPFLPA